jgi:predicted small secreted protein
LEFFSFRRVSYAGIPLLNHSLPEVTSKEAVMKQIVTLIAMLCICGMLLTSTVGCNTMAGMGQDIESAGEAIEEEAED